MSSFELHHRASTHRVLGVTALVAALSLASCGDDGTGDDSTTGGSGDSGASGEMISVGVLASQTGYLASQDNAVVEGAKLAVEKVNSEGLAGDHELSLHVVDVESSAPAATTEVQQMIAQGEADVLLSGYLSAAVTAVMPALQSNELTMVATAVIPPEAEWAFTVTPPVESWVEMQVNYIKEALDGQRIGLLFSQTPYGQQISDALTDAADANDMEIVAAEGAAADATDLTPQLDKLRAAEADVIIDGLFGAQHLVMAKNAAALGMSTPIIGGPDANSTYAQASEEYDELVYLAFPTQIQPDQIVDPEQREATSAFLEAWDPASRSGEEPTFAAGQGWDAVMVLAEVLASSDDMGEAFRSAVESATVQGTTNSFAYTESDHTGQLGRSLSEVPWTIVRNESGVPDVLFPEDGAGQLSGE